MKTGMTLAWVGAIAAIVAQFWGSNYYLSLIGGVLVAIGLMMK